MVSGFALFKPTQLFPLTWVLGGYNSARVIHFTVTIAFVLFFVVHIVQVARAGWRNFTSMVTGYEVVDRPTITPRDTTSDSASESAFDATAESAKSAKEPADA